MDFQRSVQYQNIPGVGLLVKILNPMNEFNESMYLYYLLTFFFHR